MSLAQRQTAGIPPEQQAIRDKCFHPTGTFIEFRKEDIEQSIPERFEQQVRKYPNRPAVRSWNCQLTYDQLNQAANRVAHGILDDGVDQGPIALLLEQSAQMICSIFGVLKAGRTLVPLSPSSPRERVNFMLADSQAKLLITNDRNTPLAQELAPERRLINIDQPGSCLSPPNPGLYVAPYSPASIFYTSGSTGQPKGVVQSHRNLLHAVMVRTNLWHICPDDRSALLGLATSRATKTVFDSLLNGAALCLLDVSLEGVTPLANWFIQEEITCCHLASPLFRQVVQTLPGEQMFPNLRIIRLASDTVCKRDVEAYKQYFSPECILINGLSSSETGNTAKYFMDKNTHISGNDVPVGYPVEDMEILITNNEGREVRPGQMGEISVRSRFLANGYWQRPDITQTSFSHDPTGIGQRIYKTGDLGRMSPDGCLWHMGRKDFRVKIRGFSVELSEIERALLEIEAVREAVVVVQEERRGKRLIAYLVPVHKPIPNNSELRNILAAKLPDYMVPSAFLWLKGLPQLPNGKVNRQALPAPTKARPRLESDFIAPRTPVEKKLANIWAEVLDLDEIGSHDHFLELGGDSLLASQVISQVIKTFRVHIPLRSLFEAPTIGEMAAIILQYQLKQADQEVIDRMLEELEDLSAGQAQRLLTDEHELGR